MIRRSCLVALAVALAFGSMGSSQTLAQNGNAIEALTNRAGLAMAQIHKQLRPYDRALQMRIVRGGITAQQAADLLKQKGEALASGAASAPQLQAEERQEAEAFFAAILQAAANSTKWPSDKTPAFYRAFAETTVNRAREQFKAASDAGHSTEHALSSAYRAFALARGELVQVATPFLNTERRIAASIDLPQVASIPQTANITPASAPAADPATPSPRGQLLGCFRDTNAPFDLDGFLERSAQNTPARCIATCQSKGFRFAGVQYGQSCVCGNSFGRYGAASNCNMTCTGNAAEVCGGMNSNNVFRTGL